MGTLGWPSSGQGKPSEGSNVPVQKLLSESDFNCCLCYQRLKVVMSPRASPEAIYTFLSNVQVGVL